MENNKNRLHLLAKASGELIKTLDLKTLLAHILDIAMEGLDADRGTVYIVDKNKNEIWSIVFIGEKIKEIRLPIGTGLAGTTAKTGETINIQDAYQDDRFNMEVDQHSGYRTKSCLCVPIKDSDNKIVGVFQMLNKKSGTFDKSDEDFLKSLSNYSSTALELATLHEEIIDKKRIEHELGIARQIQVSLLPHTIPEIEGYEAFGDNNSCEQVSGDYYDIFSVGENKWLFAIGDVSGKGTPASLMMAVLQSHLKAITMSFHSIPEVVKMLNMYLVDNSTSEKYITFFMGILDANENSFEFVNAGHNPPVFITSTGDLKELKTGGTVIGMFPGLEYEHEKIFLNSGDTIVCFTDGVTECFNKKEEEYGEERLYEFLKKEYSKNLKELFAGLDKELLGFAAGQKQSDDITILMLKRK